MYNINAVVALWHKDLGWKKQNRKKNLGDSSKMEGWCWDISPSSPQILTSRARTPCSYPRGLEMVHAPFTSYKCCVGCLPCCVKCFFLNGHSDFLSFYFPFPKHLDQGSLTDVQILESNATQTEVLGKRCCRHPLGWEREVGLLRPLASPTTYRLFLWRNLRKDLWFPNPCPSHPVRSIWLGYKQLTRFWECLAVSSRLVWCVTTGTHSIRVWRDSS